MKTKKEADRNGAAPNNYLYCKARLSEMQVGSQNYLVLNHILHHGSITAAQAYQKYGILALHSRISDLRNIFLVPIHKEMKRKNGKSWGEYTIEEEQK